MSYQEERLGAIADAIKYKSGNSSPIVANDFAAAILNLPTSSSASFVDISANTSVELSANGFVTPITYVKIQEE